MASFHFTIRDIQRFNHTNDRSRTRPFTPQKSVFPLYDITTQHIPPYASLSAEDRETKEDLRGLTLLVEVKPFESREGD